MLAELCSSEIEFWIYSKEMELFVLQLIHCYAVCSMEIPIRVVLLKTCNEASKNGSGGVAI